jgi:hypothetical protein
VKRQEKKNSSQQGGAALPIGHLYLASPAAKHWTASDSLSLVQKEATTAEELRGLQEAATGLFAVRSTAEEDGVRRRWTGAFTSRSMLTTSTPPLSIRSSSLPLHSSLGLIFIDLSH